ncbi:hypothetical protein [Streptomyces sp. AF1A]|jgi:hypothetical protein|uniref:hypothetical protein n=1 Tax=Streptomyces sp. AF1A TaxID=3394350 RepID=UPI0039BC2944
MSIPRKIATVSGLVGTLAALCAGAGHAYADGALGECRTSEQGGTVCVHKSESHLDKGRLHIIKQAQDCSTSDHPHVVFSKDRSADDEAADAGQSVDCSNTVKLPKGFRKPDLDF